ncbi:MAG: TIGR03790 family protein [Bacteroidia bacterium]
MKYLLRLLTFLLLPVAATAQAPVDYTDVGLIINMNSTISQNIGNYFIQERQVPLENVIMVDAPAREQIDDAEWADIRKQIEDTLIARNLHQKLNYLVTTKGVPLKINRGGQGSTGSQSASFDAELMLILGDFQIHIGLGDIVIPPNILRVQPYIGAEEHFSRAEYGIYLVTRLTGYNEQDVYDLIDRSGPNTLVNKDSALFVLDMENSPIDANKNNNMETAAQILQHRGWNVLLDKTDSFIRFQHNVLGYVSWGSNDSRANKETAIPHNTWQPAALAETYVSTGGRTFDSASSGQSLVVDLFAEGCSGASAYVYEPFSFAITEVQILFDRYTDTTIGMTYNLAESFYAGNPTLSWMAIVVGDPKTSIITHIPAVPDPAFPADLTACQWAPYELSPTNGLSGRYNWFRGTKAEVEAEGLPYNRSHPRWEATGPVFSPATAVADSFYYCVYQENISGAALKEVMLIVSPCSGIEEETFSELELFPNPAEEYINLEMILHRPEQVSLQITNAAGSLVYQQTAEAEAGIFRWNGNISHFASGFYVMKITAGNIVAYKKFVKP